MVHLVLVLYIRIRSSRQQCTGSGGVIRRTTVCNNIISLNSMYVRRRAEGAWVGGFSVRRLSDEFLSVLRRFARASRNFSRSPPSLEPSQRKLTVLCLYPYLQP